MEAGPESARWDRLEEIFANAVALGGTERSAYLEKACAGDAALRAEIDSLLQHADGADLFFDSLQRSVFVDAAEGRAVLSDSWLADFDPLIGKFVERYAILERLGVGGMGVVYRAFDNTLGRTVALKFLPPHLSADPAARDRLMVEARAAAALEHNHICTVHEIGHTDDGQLFIAMAYYEGLTLRERVAEGPLPVQQAIEYTRQAAVGLARAHAAGVIHRDVKPGNLLLTPTGTVKVLDFGLAKLADVSLTRGRRPMGTIQYMSPEQAKGSRVDHRTDVWSLAVTLYELLTGAPPFDDDAAANVVRKVMTEDPPPLRKQRPDVPLRVERAVTCALAKNPNDRQDSVTEFVEQLLGRSIPIDRPVRELPSRRAAAQHVLVAMLILLAIGSVAIVALTRDGSGTRALGVEETYAVFAFGPSAEPSAVDLAAVELGLGRALARWRPARVVPATELRGARGRANSLREALGRAGATSATAVAVVSVDPVGDSVALTLRAYDAPSGRETTLRPVLNSALFGDLEPAVNDLSAALLGLPATPFSTREMWIQSPDTRAWNAWASGQAALHQFDLASSERFFRLALSHDSSFATARLGLATALAWGSDIYNSIPLEMASLREAERALDEMGSWPATAALDRVVQLALGLAATQRYDFAEARRAYSAVLSVQPEQPFALVGLGRSQLHDPGTHSVRGIVRPRGNLNEAGRLFAEARRHRFRPGHALEVFRRMLIARRVGSPGSGFDRPGLDRRPGETPNLGNLSAFGARLQSDSVLWVAGGTVPSPRDAERMLRAADQEAHVWLGVDPTSPEAVQAVALVALARYEMLRNRDPVAADSVALRALIHADSAMRLRSQATDQDVTVLMTARLAAGDPRGAVRLWTSGRPESGRSDSGADPRTLPAANAFVAMGMTGLARATLARNFFRTTEFGVYDSRGQFVLAGDAVPRLADVIAWGATGHVGDQLSGTLEAIMDAWEQRSEPASRLLRSRLLSRVAPGLALDSAALVRWTQDLPDRRPSLDILVGRPVTDPATALRAEIEANRTRASHLFVAGLAAQRLGLDSLAVRAFETIDTIQPAVHHFDWAWGLRPQSLYWRSVSYERLGDSAAARAALREFVSAWAGADPLTGPQVDAARAALDRLEGIGTG